MRLFWDSPSHHHGHRSQALTRGMGGFGLGDTLHGRNRH